MQKFKTTGITVVQVEIFLGIHVVRMIYGIVHHNTVDRDRLKGKTKKNVFFAP